MPYELEPKLEWSQLATFVPNKHTPVYNWFYYKEGFSRELVFKACELLGLKESGKIVLDPFCGSGTTLLACSELGITSIGMDVQPSALLASRVKTRNYNEQLINEIKFCADEIRNEKFERVASKPPAIVKKVFTRHNMEDLAFLRKNIFRFSAVECREFLLLALVNSAMRCSMAHKDGGAIKVRKREHIPPLKKMFFRTVKSMLKETNLPSANSHSVSQTVLKEDARMMPLKDESVDGIITSPPYLNQIDYTRSYAIENWIVGGDADPMIRSFIGVEHADKGWDFIPWMPPQASAYFKDMNDFLNEAYRVCRKGAGAAIVIGNAYFPPPNSPVESDIILAGLAEKAGFEIEKILVLNQRAALRDRTIKVGTLRESMILMRK